MFLADDLAAAECLAFAQDFHAKAIAGDESAELGLYLEPGEESDNTTYQVVNIHSDITHILWGDSPNTRRRARMTAGRINCTM